MTRCLAASLLVCRAAFAAGVPWANLGPGGGGWIMSVAASPHDRNIVIAGGDTEGVFLSQDGGQTWTPRNSGLHDPWVEAILFHPTDPKVIFIAGKSGVYRSTDGGQTWTWLRNGFPALAPFSYTAPVGSLLADPSAPATLYAGIGSQRNGIGAQGTIYKTTDGGDHWFKVNKSGLPEDALITAMVIHPTDTSHLYVSSNKGVYESLDSGVTWTGLNAGLPLTDVRYLVVAKSNPKVLYATLRTPTVLPWRGGVYKSNDGGRNWLAINNGLSQKINSAADPQLWSEYYRLAVDPADERIVYVGTTDFVTHTLFKTVDGGANWLPILAKPPSSSFDPGWNTAFGETVQCLAMSPLDSKLLFFGNGMHIYKTPDAGANWQQLFTRKVGANWQTNGLEVIQPWMVSVDPRNPSRLFFGYADVGLWVSEDRGQSFLGYHMPARETFDGDVEDVFASAVASDPTNPNHLWAVLQEAGKVYESLDGSVSWTLRSTGLPRTPLGHGSHEFWRRRQLLLDPETRRLLANVDGKGIYSSSNGGVTWSPSSTGLPVGADIRDLVGNPADLNIYWCLLEGSGSTPASVYRSADRGTTWTLVSDHSLQAFDVFQLVVSVSDPRRLYLTARQPSSGGVSFPGGIYSSADGGVSWTRILSDSCLSMAFCSGPFAYAVAVDPTDANVVYAGLKDDPYHDDSNGGGLELSTDGGATWAPIDDTLPSHCIRTITIDPADRTRVYAGTCGNGVFRLDLSGPVISFVANAFGDTPLIAPNTWVEIKGLNLAPAGDTRIWLGSDFTSGQLPTQLDGVSAVVNGKSGYLYYISPTQIDILTPPDTLTTPAPVQVTVGGVRSNIATVSAQSLSLSFFEFVSSDKKHFVYGRHPNGDLIGPPGLFPAAPSITTPVKPGEAIYIAATGFGPTNVPVVSGSISQSGTLPTPLPVVKVGNIQANVSFAGLVGVGTYQINFVVPPNAPDGDLALSATYQGLTIQSGLLITVKH